MGVSRTVSEINSDFSRKTQYFPHPRVFCAPAKGFPLELDTGARDLKKTRMMMLPAEKEF